MGLQSVDQSTTLQRHVVKTDQIGRYLLQVVMEWSNDRFNVRYSLERSTYTDGSHGVPVRYGAGTFPDFDSAFAFGKDWCAVSGATPYYRLPDAENLGDASAQGPG